MLSIAGNHCDEVRARARASVGMRGRLRGVTCVLLVWRPWVSRSPAGGAMNAEKHRHQVKARHEAHAVCWYRDVCRALGLSECTDSGSSALNPIVSRIHYHGLLFWYNRRSVVCSIGREKGGAVVAMPQPPRAKLCAPLVPRASAFFSSSFVSQRITSGTIMYIGQCKEFHGQAVHKLAAALQEDVVAAPSGLIKVAVW